MRISDWSSDVCASDLEICISQTRSRRLGRFFDHRPEAFQEAFTSLTMHVVWLARALLPDMRERRWGRFVHVVSTAAKVAVHDIPHVVLNTMATSIMGLLNSLSAEIGRASCRARVCQYV